jgi:hypothetical protein
MALLLLALAAGGLLPGPAARAQEASCRVQGRVLDHDGRPVAGIHVRLARGIELLNAATDEDGRYDFGTQRLTTPTPGAPAPQLSVELLAEPYEVGGPPAFTVLYQQRPPILRSDSFSGPTGGSEVSCERDFTLGALPAAYSSVGAPEALWPDIVEIYRRTEDAWRLGESLGIPLAGRGTLPVYAWCDDRWLGCPTGDQSTELARFIGSHSDGSYTTWRPFIAFGAATSALDHGGRPDNREYHEIGHLAQHQLFSQALPLHPENANHGGYYRNSSTADSWVEGFAEFFSAMVSKHIDGDPAPERYRLFGAEFDIEFGHPAWEWWGWWEELAIAGLLLDFEDGDADYRERTANRALHVGTPRASADPIGVLIEGSVTNSGADPIEGGEVVVELLDRGGRVTYRSAGPTIPARLAAGQAGRYAIPIPAAAVYDRLRVTAGPLPTDDDDPIDVTLQELIDAIADYRGDHRFGNGHVFDVAELYEALSEAFGGSDRDRDGMEDVEQLFVAHGLFADLDGDRVRDGASERAGLTSHPAFYDFPARRPREELGPPAEGLVVIDSGGVATHAVVHVSYPPPLDRRSSGYVAAIEDGRVLIAPPARDSGAIVTVIAYAEGYQPAIAGRYTADELWQRWDAAPGQSSLALTVTLVPEGAPDDSAAALAAGDDDDGDGIPPWLIGVASALGVATLGGYGWGVHAYFTDR